MARTVGLIIETNQEKLEADIFICPACGKEYKTEAGLENHMTEKHPDYKPD